MSFYGLHWLDVLIVLAYLIALLIMGYAISHGIKGEEDYFLAGRKLGKIYQFFLAFGNMTDANGPPSVTSEVYRQGIAGMWIGFQTVLITPFYWFSAVWFRRARLVTMADLFVDRFNSKKLAGLYAVFNILIVTFFIAVGYTASYKTLSALMVKTPAEYSVVEAEQVSSFARFNELENQYVEGTLSPELTPEYQTLADRNARGELLSYVTYLDPYVFYILYCLIVGAYIIQGGFTAAAVTDAIQGLLIIIFSIILIPFGLAQLGGFNELKEQVPEHYLNLFGSGAASEYAWHSILAILVTSLVQIFGLPHNMQISGSAKSENAARIGLVTGSFAKRLMIIAWAICGLIAVAIFTQGLSDPDIAWGSLCRELLVPGALGLMLAGILAANMSTLDAGALTASALVVRNVIEPMVGKTSERISLLAGRLVAGLVLVLGLVTALYVDSIIALLKMIIILPTIFGAAVLLIFFWRRLTAASVAISVVIWIVVMGLLPWLAPLSDSWRQRAELHTQTPEIVATLTEAGETRELRIAPRSVYWDSVALVEGDEVSGQMEGIGRFNVEVYIAASLGLPVDRFTPAQLETTRWAFAAVFAFTMLIGFSLVTKQTDPEFLDRFYAKMRTPVDPDPLKDRALLEASQASPQSSQHLKLFPSSNWEFTRWSAEDAWGFIACWLLVGLIIVGLVLLLS